LKDGVRLNDIAGLPTTELYAQTLMEVIVARHLRIAPQEVTSDQFDTICAALASEPLDILDLSGCTQIRDFSGLVQLSISLELPMLKEAGAAYKCLPRAGPVATGNIIMLNKANLR
jgi:hypothetical protein